MKAIRTILAAVRHGDETYDLIQAGDRIVVGVSGGKDSLLLVYALSLYQKFAKKDFTIQPVMLDLGFPGFNPEPARVYIESLGLTLLVRPAVEVYPILSAHQLKDGQLSCSICSRMKKAAINKAAQELGYQKVAFAHHGDDAIETLLMNQIFGARFATFAPKMHLERADVTFIRPFIHVRENQIIRAVKELGIPAVASPCPSDGHTTREDIKGFLNQIYKDYPSAHDNFLTMLSNYEKSDLWFDEINYQIEGTELTMRPVTSAYDGMRAAYIRQVVFVQGQAVPAELEFDGSDEFAHSFLLLQGEEAIGTIRYLVDGPHEFHLGRVAIIEKYRNQGYGSLMMKWIHKHIYDRYNPATITIHAQAHLKAFYQRFGYEVKSDIFMEAGIPHYMMQATLDSSKEA
jgi:tRNA(Ile)-lysidine synthase TilS/MesJ/predicted GNAT family N-acyltransferase